MVAAAAVFRLQGQCSAERVEPEKRIRAGHQGHFRNREFRDQVPAHDIAERLIQPNSIHVDGNALRRAEQRRRGIAAVVQVGLVRIALNFVDVHAVEASVHEIGQIQSAAVFDIALVPGLHRQWNLSGRKSGSGERRRAYDVDLDRLSALAAG